VDDPVRDQRLTGLGFWSRVSDGVQWISRLVAAASVLSLLSKVMSVPSSTWIETVLAAYRALFHPIVEGTIGLIPRVFGRVLLPQPRMQSSSTGYCAGRYSEHLSLCRETPKNEGAAHHRRSRGDRDRTQCRRQIVKSGYRLCYFSIWAWDMNSKYA